MCGWVQTPDYLDSFGADLDGADIIPRSEWEGLIRDLDETDLGLERMICKIKNQGREPSCVYNAGAQATEIRWNAQFGTDEWVELSPISGYRYNGTRSSGSSVGGCAVWMEGTGLLPANSQRNRDRLLAVGKIGCVHPSTGYSVQPESGWKSTAKLFRSDEWIKVRSVEAWFSALLRGFPCVGGRSGHCICHVRPAMRNGSFVSVYANSWSPAWGATLNIATGPSGGFGTDSESAVRTMVNRDGWAIRTVLVPPWLQ
jgi:hypothetical protein